MGIAELEPSSDFQSRKPVKVMTDFLRLKRSGTHWPASRGHSCHGDRVPGSGGGHSRVCDCRSGDTCGPRSGGETHRDTLGSTSVLTETHANSRIYTRSVISSWPNRTIRVTNASKKQWTPYMRKSHKQPEWLTSSCDRIVREQVNIQLIQELDEAWSQKKNNTIFLYTVHYTCNIKCEDVQQYYGQWNSITLVFPWIRSQEYAFIFLRQPRWSYGLFISNWAPLVQYVGELYSPHNTNRCICVFHRPASSCSASHRWIWAALHTQTNRHIVMAVWYYYFYQF